MAAKNHHVKTVHRAPHVCDQCGRTFMSKVSLQQHVDDHNGPRETVDCEVCGKTYSTKLHLKRHMKTMHVEENRKPQTCSVCNKILSSVNALYHHMNYVHKLEAKFECEICGKKFKRPKNLRVSFFLYF